MLSCSLRLRELTWRLKFTWNLFNCITQSLSFYKCWPWYKASWKRLFNSLSYIDDDGVSSDLPLICCCLAACTCCGRCRLLSSVAEAMFGHQISLFSQGRRGDGVHPSFTRHQCKFATDTEFAASHHWATVYVYSRTGHISDMESFFFFFLEHQTYKLEVVIVRTADKTRLYSWIFFFYPTTYQ